MKLFAVGILLVLVVGGSSVAQNKSPYAGQEKRSIKSLSKSDISDLENGRGWGLAKAAELNGFPGPVHLLELSAKLDLSQSQLRSIEQIFKSMKEQAVPLGRRLIDAEMTLDRAFASRNVTANRLREITSDIGKIRGELRYIHLVAHLKTVEILTVSQIQRYNVLRGYSSKDPCTNIPEGHDPEMWRRHNGC